MSTNIVLRLRTGEEIEVIYPLMVFIECETPWAHHRAGYLQTTDAERDLQKFREGRDFTESGRFVIGTWMPEYGTNKNRVRTVFLSDVEVVVPASEAATTKGEAAKAKEVLEMQRRQYPQGCPTRAELAEIFPDAAAKLLGTEKFR